MGAFGFRLAACQHVGLSESKFQYKFREADLEGLVILVLDVSMLGVTSGELVVELVGDYSALLKIVAKFPQDLGSTFWFAYRVVRKDSGPVRHSLPFPR